MIKSQSFFPKVCKCPYCSELLELEEKERINREFFCPNCSKLITLEKDILEKHKKNDIISAQKRRKHLILSKKQILNAIKEEAKIIKDCYYRTNKISELLVAEFKQKSLSQQEVINSEIDKKIDEAIIERDEKIKKNNLEYEKKINSTLKKHKEQMQKINAEFASEKEESERIYEKSINEINTGLMNLSKSLSWSELDFGDEIWNSYFPMSSAIIPKLTRIGELEAVGKNTKINFPALLPIIGNQHVFIKASGKEKDSAIEAMQTIMLRLLAALPAGKLKFIFIDPVGLGSNMAGFMHLPKDLFGSKAWTEANHIEQRLADLSEHMEMVIQKYLKNRYEDMEEYNIKAGEVAEPYRILAVANFPVNFTESSARRLVNIATNGSKTGVHVIVTIDKSQPLPYGFELSELERTGIIIDFDDTRWVWQDRDFAKCDLHLDRLPEPNLFNQIVLSIGEESNASKKVEVPFEKTLPEYGSWWDNKKGDSSTGLTAPIGKIGADESQNFDLGKATAQHAIVAGKTGSGKSNLLHIIIMSLAIKYSPDELELYLIDFKKGIEFKDYATYNLPHAKVIAIQSEREFGVSVLQGLDEELQRRGDLFRDKSISDIHQYRDKYKQEKMPRILLLVDEYQEFFSRDDSYASEVSLILDRLVRQGRALGIHILLASQAMAGTYSMSRSTTDQMAVRIALQCSEADSRLILGDDNPAARLLSRPGEAIYNAANGSVEGNSLFQVFLLSDESREKLLIKIQQKLNNKKIAKLGPPIVFEGNAPAELESNREFIEFVKSKDWPKNQKAIKAWLGEPIAIKSHTHALFRKQSRSNFLIIGQNEQAASAMIITALISLVSQQSPSEASFYIINLSKADSEWYNLPTHLSETIPHEINIAKRHNITNLIENVAKTVRQRIEKIDDLNNKKIFLTFIGLSRARDLRSEDIYTPSSGAEDLSFILREGPDVDVHVLIWCDTISNFERVFERKMISEFDLRVALQMSADDSHELIDSDLANKLEPQRAIFYDEERTGSLEKFRPYAIPKIELLEELGILLRKK